MHAPSAVSPTLQAALEAVLRHHFDAPDGWREASDPLRPLVDLVNALRRHRPRRPEAPVPLTALIELLEQMPAHRAALAACLRAQVEGRSLRGALTDPGILAHSDLFGEVLRRVRKKLLPELPEEGSIQRLLVQLFYQRGDDRWLSRIPDDDARTLFRLLGGRAFRADGGDDGAYAEVLQAAVVLGHRVTGRAMEPELLRMVPDLDRYENPFLALQRELDDLQQRVHRDRQLIRTDDLDHRHLLVLLGQCMATIDQAFANSATQGISLRVNQSLLRMRQQLERMRVLLHLAAVAPEADAEDRTVALARTLAVINGGRNNIRDLLADSTQQVSFEITQHTGRTGEHYITSTAAEYRHMFLSAAGGGAIVAFMCIVKVMLGLLHPPLFVKALLASLNYAAGFILIYLAGATLATKQPAMTAATLVRSLKEDRGGDYAAFAELFARLFRSQFVAFMGNVLLAFPVALGLVAGLHALTGFNVGGHIWLKLVSELNPLTSLALPHAAIAGVFLFLSGLIAGSVANTTRHERIPERIAEHPWLKRTVGTRGARRLADLYARRWAGIASNLWFGVFMGSTAAIGLFLGLPLDIRHITFAAGNLAIGLFGSGWQLGPWVLMWSVAGIGLIGFVNFAVSFGLSLSLAMRSRAIPYRDLSAILLAIGRHARRHPLRFLVPTRASARAEVPNGSITTTRMHAALAFSLLPALLHAQVNLPVFGKQQVINGYAKDGEGEVLSYFSVYPEHATTALLTRCTDGKKAIAWETAATPLSERESVPYYYFSWIAAHNSTTSGGDRSFDLYINDAKALTFTTHHSTKPGTWSAAGADSTKLLFEFIKADRHGDAHGFAHLRVPRKYITLGEPVKLKVVGHAQDSPDWFMTFRYTFEEKVEVEVLPFIYGAADKETQPLQLTVMHFGGPSKLKVEGPFHERTFEIRNGLQTIETPITLVRSPGRMSVRAWIDGRLLIDATIETKPVIHRDVYLVHHSHTDIGYSHLQAEVEKIQNNNIWKALELIDRTKDYPEGSRFVWNVESLWAVENFLGIASEQDKQRFIAAVKSGSIALSANYANLMTGLCTPEEMHWIVEYADSLRAWYDLPITMAMQTDVPGMSWSMVDAYAAHGIRHLSQGPNYIPDMPDGGDRIGSTLREQGDKPYWWKGTTGRDSILVWTAGQGYGGWHGYTAGAIKERGTRKIAAYMNELAAKGYPYEMVQWRYNIVSDNGPVDSTLSDFVRDWNEKYISPRLIFANAGTMLQEFEEKHGKQIPTWSGDFTPYWEDGAYSTAKEEGDVRVLSARLSNLIEAAKLLDKPIDPHLLYRAKRSIVMWHEHTWGAWCSISDPDAHFTKDQWRVKKAFADSAGWYLMELEKRSGVKPAAMTGYSIDALPPEFDWYFVEGLDPTMVRRQDAGGLVEDEMDEAYQHVHYKIDPNPSRSKHSSHLALPFNIPNAIVRIGIGDTCVTPESGRIPGSNNDFFCAQRWIDVSNDSMGVTIVCPQGAIWEVGDMVDERKVNPGKGTNPELYKAWKTEAKSSSTLYLYALNNTWHTNFKADQEGPITFDLYLKMHGPFKLEEARRFGLEMTRPLITWWK